MAMFGDGPVNSEYTNVIDTMDFCELIFLIHIYHPTVLKVLSPTDNCLACNLRRLKENRDI